MQYFFLQITEILSYFLKYSIITHRVFFLDFVLLIIILSRLFIYFLYTPVKVRFFDF